jgi:hypothetical protein
VTVKVILPRNAITTERWSRILQQTIANVDSNEGLSRRGELDSSSDVECENGAA